MSASSASLVVRFIGALRSGDEAAVIAALEDCPADDPVFAGLLRAAAFHASPRPLYYKRLRNLWSARGRASLKPNARAVRLEILADGTVNGLAPYLELFCAILGVDVQIMIGDYDSVEHVALSGDRSADVDVTVVVLSEQWLRRHMTGHLVSRRELDETKALLGTIIDGLSRSRSGRLLMLNFALGAWPTLGTLATAGDSVGRAIAAAELTSFLVSRASDRCNVLDTGLATHLAGGADAMGRLSFLRTRAPFEERGLVSVAREIASAIAYMFGKSHRALLTDWDNTLWGGEVGEVGPQGIVCGQDTPDGLGYFLLQSYLRDMTGLGVLLAAVSRNEPEAAGVLDTNKDNALGRSHFASLALSWGNKSESVAAIQRQFAFGVEFMVYLDDSPVDLAEVLVEHPDIDIVIAGPNPDESLVRLVAGKYFNALRMTEDDAQRGARASALVEQRDAWDAAGDVGQFLKSLNMQLSASGINDLNKERVLQLLQKTNQFNLTGERYTQQNLSDLATRGAMFGAFSYSDRFGSQGLIAFVILVPDADDIHIDTWLMSCRVLNRGVEHAVFEWILRRSAGKCLRGRYVPTAKNALVATLYERLGFEAAYDSADASYQLTPAAAVSVHFEHYLECIDE